ncbi:MAG: hypothetical protein HYY49_08085 [Ignavibacteriales bacterium]|nr:hypothetical protein [Ignavibacteriales bacterium]
MAEMTMGVTQQIQAVWDTMPSLKDISPENFLDLLAVRTRVPNWGGLDQSRLDAQVVNYMPFVQPSFLELVFSLTTNIRANGLLFRQTIKKLKPSLLCF